MVMQKTPSPGRDLGQCLDVINRALHTRRELLMDDAAPQADLTRALLDAVGLFEQLGISYALVGGLAAMYYGRARFTEDVDFIAAADHEQTLAQHPDAMRQWHFDPSCTWKLYHQTGIAIDLWKDAHVPAMLQRAISARLAGQTVQMVEVYDLLAMKLRADRPQDDYDISEICKQRQIDEQLLRQRVEPAQFERFVQLKKRAAR